MESTTFSELCKKLGNQSLPEAERWKSIKYILCEEQNEPSFDFQAMLNANRVAFIDDDDVGEGFLVLDYTNSDLGVIQRNNLTATFIPLERILIVSFVVEPTSEGNISIDEIVSKITGDTYDIPVVVSFSNSLYYFKHGDPLVFAIIFDKDITSTEYDIAYFDVYGNELDAAPTAVGSYKITVTCKNGYTGYGECRFNIQ